VKKFIVLVSIMSLLALTTIGLSVKTVPAKDKAETSKVEKVDINSEEAKKLIKRDLSNRTIFGIVKVDDKYYGLVMKFRFNFSLNKGDTRWKSFPLNMKKGTFETTNESGDIVVDRVEKIGQKKAMSPRKCRYTVRLTHKNDSLSFMLSEKDLSQIDTKGSDFCVLNSLANDGSQVIKGVGKYSGASHLILEKTSDSVQDPGYRGLRLESTIATLRKNLSTEDNAAIDKTGD
jgi:hypothetical protein